MRASEVLDVSTSPLSMTNIICAVICAVTMVMSAAPLNPLEARPRLAVLELTDYAKLSRFELKSMTSLLRGSAARDGRYHVITQENVTELLPNDIQLEECVGRCEVETGRRVGAALVMTGEVGRIDEDVTLILKLFSSQRADLIAQSDLTAPDVRGIHRQLNGQVSALLSEVHAGDRAIRRAQWLLGFGLASSAFAGYWWGAHVPELEAELDRSVHRFSDAAMIRHNDARVDDGHLIGWSVSALSVALIGWALYEWLQAPPSSDSLLYERGGER